MAKLLLIKERKEKKEKKKERKILKALALEMTYFKVRKIRPCKC
jgi:hypothetical protein